MLGAVPAAAGAQGAPPQGPIADPGADPVTEAWDRIELAAAGELPTEGLLESWTRLGGPNVPASGDAAQALGLLSFELVQRHWDDSVPLPAEVGIDVDDLFELVDRALAVGRDPDMRASARQLHARRLIGRGQLFEARELLEAALDELVEPIFVRPWLAFSLADTERLLGRRARARDALRSARAELEVARAATAELEPGYRAAARLDVRLCEAYLRGLDSQLLVEQGLPDMAIAPLLEMAELLPGTDTVAGHQAESAHRIYWLGLRLALQDFERVVRRTDEWLRSPEAAALPPADRARLAFLGASARAELARRDRSRSPTALAALSELDADRAHLAPFETVELDLSAAEILLRESQLAPGGERLRSARSIVERWTTQLGSPPPPREAARLESLEARYAIARGAAPDELVRRRDALRAAFDSFLDEWKALPPREGGSGFLFHDHRRAVLCDLIAIEVAVAGPEVGGEAALVHEGRCREQGTLFKHLTADRPVLAERSLDGVLGAGSGALVYLPGPDGSWVIAVDPGGARAHPLDLPPDWRRTVRDWLTVLDTSPGPLSAAERAARSERLRSTGDAAAGVLLPAAVRAELARWRSVAFVGRDLIGYVPFEALPLADGGLLGLRMATWYLPSLGLGTVLAEALEDALARPATPGDPEALLIACASHPDVPPERTIPWSAERERAFLSVYGDGARVAAGGAGVLSALRSMRARRVTQITAHGLYDRDEERPDGVLLSPEAGSDGRVGHAELEEIAASPVVVLTVCGAGRGPRRSGDDGATDLGSAFLSAGALTVVLSPADLEARSSLTLAEHFHRALRRGEPAATALLHARLALAETERWSDPHYHSMMHVHGLGGARYYEPTEQVAGAGGAAEGARGPWPAALAAAILVAIALLVTRRARATES